MSCQDMGKSGSPSSANAWISMAGTEVHGGWGERGWAMTVWNPGKGTLGPQELSLHSALRLSVWLQVDERNSATII